MGTRMRPLVKRCLRLAAGGMFLLALSACELLFIGAFPPSVGQATARADLSGDIDPSTASYFTLSTVNAGGIEYVLLFTGLGVTHPLPVVALKGHAQYRLAVHRHVRPVLFGEELQHGL